MNETVHSCITPSFRGFVQVAKPQMNWPCLFARPTVFFGRGAPIAFRSGPAPVGAAIFVPGGDRRQVLADINRAIRVGDSNIRLKGRRGSGSTPRLSESSLSVRPNIELSAAFDITERGLPPKGCSEIVRFSSVVYDKAQSDKAQGFIP